MNEHLAIWGGVALILSTLVMCVFGMIYHLSMWLFIPTIAVYLVGHFLSGYGIGLLMARR